MSSPLPSPGIRIPVAILGATGAVGQTFIRSLRGHPWFEIVELAASERSAGRAYGEVVRWLEGELPSHLAAMTVQPCDPAKVRAPVVFAPWPYRRSLGWPYFYDPFYDPLGGWWWYPPRYPVHDVFGLALRPGVLRPGARLEGFVYFPPPPGSVRQFDAVVGYQAEGAPARSELRFPFALTRDGD